MKKVSARNISLSSQFNKLSFQNRHQHASNLTKLSNEQQSNVAQDNYNKTIQLTSKIANELLKTGYSQTAQQIVDSQKEQKTADVSESTNEATISPNKVHVLNENSDNKDRLFYLGHVMDFQINFHSLSKVSFKEVFYFQNSSNGRIFIYILLSFIEER